ncbi:MAG: glutathione S-transferase family protein [Pseudomonadota bacterium]
MGYLLDGEWRVGSPGYAGTSGEFERKASSFRNFVTGDGAPGPTGSGGFKAEADRYHLYVSYACPWAHRTLIMRTRKGLSNMIGLSVVHWFMGEDGWTFEGGEETLPDTINGAAFLRQVYQKADRSYTGRVTVPVLWDKATGTIVSNESSEIIRMFDHAFDELGAVASDHRPASLEEELDHVNDRVYDTLNNGVYRSGFATKQDAYERNVHALFDTLDWLEGRLENSDYIVGGQLTEADIRLFPTLVRFDAVYHGHFKCNIRRIVDYPRLQAYLERLYALDGFGSTTKLGHIKKHYYQSHESVNPTRIVPAGPVLPFA